MSKSKRVNDLFSVYRYGDEIKVSYIKNGVFANTQNSGKRPSVDVENVEKLDESISRTRSTIFELAACNDFEWFVTLTLDPQKMARNALKTFRKTFSGMIRDRNKYRPPERKIEYLLIPEQHKDGAWHMHGLFKGLFKKDDLIKNQYGYLDWPEYSKRFGFCSFSKVKSHVACSRYITKYVTKDVKKGTAIEFGGHSYFCSQGLARREVLLRNYIGTSSLFEGLSVSYENDYVKTYWLSLQEGLSLVNKSKELSSCYE